MFENVKDFFRSIQRPRLIIAFVVMVALFCVLLWRMFSLQIVNGQDYQDDYTLKIIKERTLNSTRGNIYDRNGVLLAYNELAYSITIEDNGTYSSTSEKNESLNAEIAQIISALEANGDAISTSFKVEVDAKGAYSYNVSGTTLRRFIADVYGASSYNDLEYDDSLGYNPADATAAQLMDYLKSRYGVDDSYKADVACQIVAVRYAMAQNAYQKYLSTTIATDVSYETVAYISEHASELQGVEVAEDTVRRYNDSVYFASIIGYTGRISSEEYATLSELYDGYTLNDVVGKSGIEQYMDAELKGTKGYEKLYVDYMGKELEVIEREEPTVGNDLYLSIDADLQIAVYNLLEQEIAGIVYANIENSSSDINIPITDVYFALINNNVIDTSHFSAKDASESEQAVYGTFKERKDAVLQEIGSELDGTKDTAFSKFSTEYQDYFTEVIDDLKDAGILLTSSIDTSDDVYVAWKNGTIGPHEYLTYAVSQNWIDVTGLDVEEKYADSDEIYFALCDYVMEDLDGSTSFEKLVYKYLVDGGEISGRDLCMILYDQGVLTDEDDYYSALASGTISPVSFLKERIKNLDITPAQLALDPCSGSCVITDVNTGEVLALVSYPGYDNNRLANTVDADYYNSLLNDLSLPLYNYATQQGTAPGSTFKLVMATAGLAEGVITTTSTITDLGVYENVDNNPRCWIYTSSRSTHGTINVSQAIQHSCNYFFYEVGYRLATNNYATSYSDSLGIEKIQKYASMYGLNETSGIEIEESQPKIATEYPVMAAIGQSDNRYTTVQLSRYVTAVANSGTLYSYTLLDHLEDSDGNVVETYTPTVESTIDVLDSSEWDAIHSGMRGVVTSSSAFSDFPIAVAGKTGTAQQISTRPNHALFIGYAPYDDPEISIAVRIAYGYSSSNAATLARNVLAYYYGVEDEDELLDGQASDIAAGGNTFGD